MVLTFTVFQRLLTGDGNEFYFCHLGKVGENWKKIWKKYGEKWSLLVLPSSCALCLLKKGQASFLSFFAIRLFKNKNHVCSDSISVTACSKMFVFIQLAI